MANDSVVVRFDESGLRPIAAVDVSQSRDTVERQAIWAIANDGSCVKEL
jgi:hypothetical protein